MERRILEFEGLEYIGFDLSMASGRPLILGDRRYAVMLWAFLRTLSVNTFLFYGVLDQENDTGRRAKRIPSRFFVLSVRIPNANFYYPHVGTYDNRMARAICTSESPLLTVTALRSYLSTKEILPILQDLALPFWIFITTLDSGYSKPFRA